MVNKKIKNMIISSAIFASIGLFSCNADANYYFKTSIVKEPVKMFDDIVALKSDNGKIEGIISKEILNKRGAVDLNGLFIDSNPLLEEVLMYYENRIKKYNELINMGLSDQIKGYDGYLLFKKCDPADSYKSSGYEILGIFSGVSIMGGEYPKKSVLIVADDMLEKLTRKYDR